MDRKWSTESEAWYFIFWCFELGTVLIYLNFLEWGLSGVCWVRFSGYLSVVQGGRDTLCNPRWEVFVRLESSWWTVLKVQSIGC